MKTRSPDGPLTAKEQEKMLYRITEQEAVIARQTNTVGIVAGMTVYALSEIAKSLENVGVAKASGAVILASLALGALSLCAGVATVISRLWLHDVTIYHPGAGKKPAETMVLLEDSADGRGLVPASTGKAKLIRIRGLYLSLQALAGLGMGAAYASAKALDAFVR